jgi:DNA-3-methyladenine glycosylase II
MKPALKWSADDRALMRADKVLKRVMEEKGPLDPEIDRRGSRPDPFEAVARAIVGQQLSTKAARTIYERLTALFGDRTPTPQELLDADPDSLRQAGLSRAKVGYLRSLAEHVLDGELQLDRIAELPDEDVAAQLIAVKGLGQWTADMFLIFHLRRPDVLPVGDLGIRRAVQIAYGLPELPAPAELTRIAEPWRPHRSLASLLLWRSLDNEPA